MPNEVNDDENIFNENNEKDSYIDKKEQKHNVKRKSGITC